MAEAASAVSLLFRPGELPGVSEGFGPTLARHLVGRRVQRGARVALPGWPPCTVEAVEPGPGEIRPGTEIEITVPPSHGEGPLNLAILVDGSLTMGEGPSPTAYERAASLVDAFLMNGRSFLASAGVLVQGGEIRHVEELTSPETLSGALIHQVQPRGTFDLDAGLDHAIDVLADAEPGPRAILLVTDGDLTGADPLASALPVARAGASLFALADEASPDLAAVCRHTGGVASSTPEPVFEALAEVAGARADWTQPEDPEPVTEPDPAFEVVIETMEESA